MTRLIPAGAGKTVDVPRWADTVEAHPRWCGENQVMKLKDQTQHGSSPLVRGKQIIAYPDHSTARLIPAGAGKTLIKLHV